MLNLTADISLSYRRPSLGSLPPDVLLMLLGVCKLVLTACFLEPALHNSGDTVIPHVRVKSCVT